MSIVCNRECVYHRVACVVAVIRLCLGGVERVERQHECLLHAGVVARTPALQNSCVNLCV